jgi:HEPN domain-containing protein
MARLAREPRRFFRAAEQRLEEAQFLLEYGDYTTAAVYLAGYAVECMLKALILASEPESRHPQTMKSFRGVLGHNFHWLRGQLAKRHVPLSAKIGKSLKEVNGWTTNLRYDPATHKRADAEEFLATVEQIILWVQGKL